MVTPIKNIFSIVFACFCLVSQTLFAQTGIKIDAPSQAQENTQIRVSYQVNSTDIDEFSVGEFTNFDILYGPSKSTSNSISIVNGRSSRNSSTTYTYVIRAVKTGTFKLPVMTVKIGDKVLKSKPFSIQILPMDSPAQSPNDGQADRSRSQGAKDEVFMLVSINKDKVYEQEPVIVTYKLYTLANVQQIAGEMPQLDGFHVQELDSKAQMSLKYERYNGRNYGTAIWRQYVLFPQKGGDFTIPSVSFDLQIEVQNTVDDPFDVFFGGGSLSQSIKRTIKTKPLALHVTPLPTPKPANFIGAVGNFQISSNLTPDQINSNDAATLRLVISGTGNTKIIKTPEVNLNSDFDTYKPKVDDRLKITANGYSGNIIYDYILVPRHEGQYDIPSMTYSYFDPQSKSYRTLSTDKHHLNVKKGKSEELNILNDDIRFIKHSSTGSSVVPGSFFATWKYWLLLVLIASSLVFIKLYESVKDKVANRSMKAGRVAMKRLRKAEKLVCESKPTLFYEEVSDILQRYAANKADIQISDLKKENIVEAFQAHHISDELTQQYIAVLEECEFARFAPGIKNEDMCHVYEKAKSILTQLEGSF